MTKTDVLTNITNKGSTINTVAYVAGIVEGMWPGWVDLITTRDIRDHLEECGG